MKIAIVGAGRIGSMFAFHLAKGGHDVTVIARGARREALLKAGAIEMQDGARAPVHVADALAADGGFDLALVTVLDAQVDAVMPALRASDAKTVLFMFNTFKPTKERAADVGVDRAAFGFPQMIAFLEGDKLRGSVTGPGMMTALSDARWAKVFADAGLPTVVEKDMDAFYRSHVAFVIPTMVLACALVGRQGGATWAEARLAADATRECFDVVRALEHRITPNFVAVLAALPRVVVAFVLWAASRSAAVKDLGVMGPSEPRALIDALLAVSPIATPALRAFRPS